MAPTAARRAQGYFIFGHECSNSYINSECLIGVMLGLEMELLFHVLRIAPNISNGPITEVGASETTHGGARNFSNIMALTGGGGDNCVLAG